MQLPFRSSLGAGLLRSGLMTDFHVVKIRINAAPRLVPVFPGWCVGMIHPTRHCETSDFARRGNEVTPKERRNSPEGHGHGGMESLWKQIQSRIASESSRWISREEVFSGSETRSSFAQRSLKF